jgi:hypothetical protein
LEHVAAKTSSSSSEKKDNAQVLVAYSQPEQEGKGREAKKTPQSRKGKEKIADDEEEEEEDNNGVQATEQKRTNH